MNKAELLHEKVIKCLETYTLDKLAKYFDPLQPSDDPRDRDYWMETHGQKNYPMGIYLYLGAVVKTIKPKTIVEIGADRGVSAMVMASELKGKIYSVDIRDGWEYVPKGMNKIVKLLGDSLDPMVLSSVDLDDVDLWFIDGLHNRDHVEKEIKLYSPHWKKGSVVLFDDVDEYTDVFRALPYDKMESREIHNSNFGIVVV